MRDPPPLRIDLEHSKWRRAYIGIAYVATMLLVGALPLAYSLRFWLVVLVASLAVRTWRERPPAGLIVRLDGTLALLREDGTSIEATLENGGYLGARFTSIVYRPLGSRRSHAIAILPDMLPSEDFRRLRVRLNYARSDDADGAPASQARASTNAPLSALR